MILKLTGKKDGKVTHKEVDVTGDGDYQDVATKVLSTYSQEELRSFSGFDKGTAVVVVL